MHLEESTVLLSLLLDEDLEVLEDDGDGEEDTSTGTDSTHKVSNDGQSTNAHTTESSGDRDIALEDDDGGLFAVTLDDHVLIAELLSNIARRRARDLNPSLGEESASNEDEGEVEDSMERIIEDLSKGVRRRDIVSQTANWDRLTRTIAVVLLLPATEKLNNDVGGITLVQELGEEVQVGDESSLKDDRNVGGVEELDWVRALLTAVLGVLHWQIDTETLEVDDDDEDEDSGEQVEDVRQVLAVESLLESADLIGTSDQQVEQSNDGTLELSTTTSVDGGRGESLPDDVLANVGGDKQRDTRTKTITLLQQFIEDDNDDTGKEELHDDENSITSAEILDITVHTRENVGNGLTDGDDDTEELLSTLKQLTIFLVGLVDSDNLRTSKQLHDQTRGHDRADTELHQSTTVGSQDNAHPVEWIRRVGRTNTIERDLAANQEDEEGDNSPHDLLLEWDLGLRGRNLWEDAHHRTNQVKETHLQCVGM